MNERGYLLRGEMPAHPRLIDLVDGRPLPPTDVRGGGFSCCGGCAVTPADRRCPDCPRPKSRQTFVVAAPRPPRRRWFRRSRES